MARFPVWAMILVAGALLAATNAVAASPADSTAVPRLPEAHARAWQLGIARPDRLRSATLAFTIGLGLGLIARRPAAAAAGGLGCAAVRQLYDLRRSGLDPLGLAAGAVGTGAAVALTAAIQD